LNRAREKLVKLAKKLGVELRQSYTRVGKFALIELECIGKGTTNPREFFAQDSKV
jgi:hypothetical protein